ncbi:MAG: ATP-binding protein [bacterium]
MNNTNVDEKRENRINKLFKLGMILGFITLFTGVMVLVGWAFDIPVLKSILPGYVSMKANTAIGFIFASLSLLFLKYKSNLLLQRLSVVFAAITVLLGFLTLIQYFFGINLGIDQLFFSEPTGTIGTFSPGRMALATAINFLISGYALLLAGSPRGIATAQRLALCIGIMGLLPLLGYLYGATAMIGIGQYTQMAVHTALLFILLSLGVLLLRPMDSLTRVIFSDTRGGWLIRFMMPFIIVFPITLGWLRIRGENADYFESQLGTALMMVILMILLLGILFWTAQMLNKEETNVKHATAALAEREALYHSLFSNMLNGYAYCQMVFEEGKPRDFIYLAVNESFYKLTGLKDVIGKKITEVIPNIREVDPQILEFYGRVTMTGQPEQQEIFVESLQMWLLLSVYCPAPEHFVAVFDVITDRKLTEVQIAASEIRYRRLFEAAHDGILILDAETGMVVDVNPYMIELLGVTREVFLGKKVWELGFFKDLVGNEANFVELQAKQHIRYEDMALEGYDGKRHEVEFISNVYLVDGNKVIQCNIRDISERARNAEKMFLIAEELERSNSELTRFLYTASHDLKSPLVTINTFLGYLTQDLITGDTQRITKDMNFMQTAIDKMLPLLDDLLEMARVGRVIGSLVHVTFREVVDDALAAVAGRIAERGIAVCVEEADGVTFYADRVRLVEIFQNLVENSCKFMGDQPVPRIEIGMKVQDAETVFFVRDNGGGIDPHHQAKVFDLFEQLDTHIDGTGIGLTLVKRIVDLHNGRIWLESAGIGQGVCFYFTLPGAIPPADAGVTS